MILCVLNMRLKIFQKSWILLVGEGGAISRCEEIERSVNAGPYQDVKK